MGHATNQMRADVSKTGDMAAESRESAGALGKKVEALRTQVRDAIATIRAA
jgi:hypothetical protein